VDESAARVTAGAAVEPFKDLACVDGVDAVAKVARPVPGATPRLLRWLPDHDQRRPRAWNIGPIAS